MTSTLLPQSRPDSRPSGPNASVAARLLVGAIGSAAAATFAWNLGSGQLGTPPVRTISWQSVHSWYGNRTPIEIGMGLIRIATLATATVSALLFLISLASALFLARPEKWAQHAGHRIAIVLPRPFRRWRDLAAGVGLSAAIAIAPMSASLATTTSVAMRTPDVATAEAAGPIGPPAPAMKRVEFVGVRRETLPSETRISLDSTETRSSSSSSSRPRVGDPTSGQQWPDIRDATVIGADPARPAAPASVVPTVSSTAVPLTAEDLVRPTTSASTPHEAAPNQYHGKTTSPKDARTLASAKRVHEVQPGESFWSIAESEMTRTNRNPTEHQVNRYCADLVEANRYKLPDPSNPDVILVGTVIELVTPSQ
jgi:hypothetical protein